METVFRYIGKSLKGVERLSVIAVTTFRSSFKIAFRRVVRAQIAPRSHPNRALRVTASGPRISLSDASSLVRRMTTVRPFLRAFTARIVVANVARRTAATFLVAALCLSAAATPAADKLDEAFWAAREKATPDRIKDKLRDSRLRIAERHLTYSVGYTSALLHPCKHGIIKKPNNLPELRDEQNRFAAKLLSIDAAAAEAAHIHAHEAIDNWPNVDRKSVV
jgi:hypothetical protein